MGKMRVGVKTGHNRKARNGATKWAKGHSSDSNPLLSKHRQAVKGRLGAPVALAVPVDEQTSGVPEIDSLQLDDAKSGVSCAESALSRVTACTNPTFVSIHRVWKSGSSNQVEVVSVLAGLTELIQEQGGKQTDAEYFAALISMIEGLPDNANVKQVAATAMLLGVVIQKIEYKTLRAVFSRLLKVLYHKFGLYASGTDESVSALKHLAISLGHLLRAQPTAIWRNPANKAILESMSAIACTHSAAPVRKFTRNAIQSIVCNHNGDANEDDSSVIVAAGAVGDYCSKHIDETANSALAAESEVLVDECRTGATKASTLYTLNLIECVYHRMQSGSFKRTTEALLTLITMADVQVRQSAMSTLYKCLLRRPDSKSLSEQTNIRLINALYDFRPAVDDQHSYPIWMLTLCEAHACLQSGGTASSQESQSMCLSRSCAAMLCTIDANQTSSVECCVSCVQRLIQLCCQQLVQNDVPGHSAVLNDILKQLHECITLRNAAHWVAIFTMLHGFFQHLGSACTTLNSFPNVIRLLVELRDSDQPDHRKAVHNCMAAAIRYCGVEAVLSHVSVGVNPDLPSLPADVPNSWMLPLIREAVNHDSLLFYCRTFMLVASKLYKRVQIMKNAVIAGDSPLLVKVYSVVQHQLWELLPSFCLHPTDFDANIFRDLSRILGVALMERAELRLVVCAALRNLCKFASSEHGTEEHRAVMASYAKNFMPILFNLYTSSADKQAQDVEGVDEQANRASVLECIRQYLQLTDKSLIADYFERAQHRANMSDAPLNRRLLTCDLVIVLLPYLEGPQLVQVKDLLTPWLSLTGEKSDALQKKAYRILEVMCQSGNADAFTDLQKLITNADVKSISHPARAAHSSVIGEMIDACDSTEKLDKLLDDVFENLVEYLDISEKTKTRANAGKRIQQLVRHAISLAYNGPPLALEKLVLRIHKLITDKASAESSVRACLIAANIVMRTEGKHANANTVDILVKMALQYVHHKGITGRCAGKLLQAIVHLGPKFVVEHYEDTIIKHIVSKKISKDTACSERMRYAKLTRLMLDQYSQPRVAKHIDESNEEWTALLRGQSKKQRRSDLKKTTNRLNKVLKVGSSSAKSIVSSIPDTVADLLRESDDEDEQEDDVSIATNRSRRSAKSGKSSRSLKSSGMWLKEGLGGTDVLDLLDSRSMASKMTSSNPMAPKKEAKEKDGGFKTTKDGRLIIMDDGEGGAEEESSDSDDEDDLLVSGKRKRRSQASDVEQKRTKPGSIVNGDYDAESIAHSQYTTGGRGIHRNLAADAKSTGGNYKAKKARGDVKKLGQKHEPYAYIPMTNSKRKAAKFGGQIKHLVAGARRGATKGNKGKSKKRSQKIVPL